MAQKRKRKSSYGPLQKYKYHQNRYYAPEKNHIKRDGGKHFYSEGFCAGVSGQSNYAAIAQNFGAKRAASYKLGQERGKKASAEYKKACGRNLYSDANK